MACAIQKREQLVSHDRQEEPGDVFSSSATWPYMEEEGESGNGFASDDANEALNVSEYRELINFLWSACWIFFLFIYLRENVFRYVTFLSDSFAKWLLYHFSVFSQTLHENLIFHLNVSFDDFDLNKTTSLS